MKEEIFYPMEIIAIIIITFTITIILYTAIYYLL